MRYEYLRLVGSVSLTENQRSPIVPCATTRPVQGRARCRKLDAHNDGTAAQGLHNRLIRNRAASLGAGEQWSRRVSAYTPVRSGPRSTASRRTRLVSSSTQITSDRSESRACFGLAPTICLTGSPPENRISVGIDMTW